MIEKDRRNALDCAVLAILLSREPGKEIRIGAREAMKALVVGSQIIRYTDPMTGDVVIRLHEEKEEGHGTKRENSIQKTLGKGGGAQQGAEQGK